jgi:4-hydroxy-3-polyprenylbenzoate decarboxylase
MPAIAVGISSNSLIQATDVSLKERRPLIVMAGETPRRLGHLRTMAALAEMDAILDPPIPSCFTKLEAVMDGGDSSAERVLGLPPFPELRTKRSNRGWAQ